MLQDTRRTARRTAWLVLALAAFSLLLAACSGDDDDTASVATLSDADSTSVADGVASAEATSTADASTGQQGTAQPVASSAGGSLFALSELRSFRYDVTVRFTAAEGAAPSTGGLTLDLGDLSLSLEGAVIAPDREHSTISADLGFLQINIESITIGTESWTREPGGEWQTEKVRGDRGMLAVGGDHGTLQGERQAAASGLDGLGLDLDFSPTALFGDTNDLDELAELATLLAAIDGTRDDVNGVEADRYDINAEQFAQFATTFGELAEDGTVPELADGEFDFSIWIARDGGFPVRMLLSGSSSDPAAAGDFHVEINLYDLNSDDIEINAPI